MSNKSISELVEWGGLINGDDVLIISRKVDQYNQYVSNKYKLASLAEWISSDVYYQTQFDISALTAQTSSELSTLMNATSSWIFSLSANVSDAISVISNTSSFISSFLSSISQNVYNDLSVYKIDTKIELCNYVESAVVPLRSIVGLSTLNYYTYIGDDITKLSVDPRYPELSSISSDVIWFDTKNDLNYHHLASIRRMDNLQVQIYRLGLQLKDVHKILENGVIPGDAYNNTKDEMIRFADQVQPPEESLTPTKELIEMSIYGNYYCKNGQLYYILFNPSGFVPSETRFDWIINDHDDNDTKIKTINCISNDLIYSLRANLVPKILSSSCQIQLSAAIYQEGEEFTYVSDQISVDEVIDVLSAMKKKDISFYVSSDYEDKTFGDNITTEAFDISFRKGLAQRLSSEFEIQGNDYIDHSSLYYCVLDESDKKFPLNVNTNWYFLSTYYVEDEWTGIAALSSGNWMSVIVDTNDLTNGFVNGNRYMLSVNVKNKTYDIASDISSFSFISSHNSQICTVLKVSSDSQILLYKDGTGSKELSVIKSDQFVRTFYPDDKSERVGKVTFSALHYLGTPICQVSVELSNCTTAEAKDISATLYVESNYDNSLSAKKNILGIGGVQPETSTMEPTVKAVCAKYDEKSNFIEKSTTMHKGEIVYFSDTNQLAVWNGEKFMVLNSSSSSGLTKEEIQDIGLDYLMFTPNSSSQVLNKLMTTSDGKTHILQKSKYDTASIYEVDKSDVGKMWISHLFQIGKIYAGGKQITFEHVVKNNIDVDQMVSHNFIELVNASDNDIYLDKVYLLYHTLDEEYKPDHTQSGNSDWEFLKLEGIIKAHGTFLIRGANCNPCDNTMINIGDCDIEWRKRTANDVDILTGDYKKFTRSGNLMEFSQKAGSFFMICATKNAEGDEYGNNIKNVLVGGDAYIPTVMINTLDNSKAGYVDLVGIGDTTTCKYFEAKPFSSPTGSFQNMLIHKWFYMDPAKQGNKVLYEMVEKNGKEEPKFRSNATLLDVINLKKQQVIFRDDNALSNRNEYYYDDEYKCKFKPGTTYNNHGIFSTKTQFNKDRPNIINITFGKQATQNGNTLASRCFNWISRGYYDEYVEIAGPFNSPDGIQPSDWISYYSITGQDHYDYIEGVNSKNQRYDYHHYYDRFRWSASDGSLVTTHKVIIKNKLYAGNYKYRIRRDNDDTYMSDILEFTVRKSSDVNRFSFVQTSDQQGFNWVEYQAWKASCTAISQHELNFDFTINTGDIAQSGNRVSEWIDYYDGRKALRKKEEMFTIGNNDLCGSPSYVLGDGNDASSKFNLINILYYYTFELDTENICYAEYEGKKYPLYSLYSFDYGEWHFISLVSEIRSYYAKSFSELAAESSKHQDFANTLNAKVEEWFKQDLNNYMIKSGNNECSKCIVFMHEMPFTMVTPDFFDSEQSGWSTSGRSTKKTGSKLNLENKNGNYRFSRIFKKAGIRLVLGGHKHTFTLSAPLYDSPQQPIVPDNEISLTSSIESEDPFLSNYVDNLDKGQEDIWSRKPVIEMPMDGVYDYVHDKIENEIKNQHASKYTNFKEYEQQILNAKDIHDEQQFTTAMNQMLEFSSLNDVDSFKFINTITTDSLIGLKDFIRIRYVNKITAPTYSMSQATGYKVVSNKELPSATSSSDPACCRYTPWLLSYCAANPSKRNEDLSWTSTKNPVQMRPTYIRYDLDSNEISVQIKQVDGVYTIKNTGDSTSYNLHTQKVVLSCDPVTFGQFGKDLSAAGGEGLYFIPTTLDDYMKIYGNYINKDTYIIKL